MHFIPAVYCETCGKAVERVEREHKPKENTRHLFAVCHGQRVEIAFATEQNARVTVFGLPKG